MALVKCWIYIGRMMLFASLTAQAAVFSRYPSIYYDNRLFNAMILLVLPTFIAWGLLIKTCKEEDRIRILWIVWGVYVFTLLLPMIGVIFGGLREKLDKNQFFGPNILKITMCGSPVIALLLFTSVSASKFTSVSDRQNSRSNNRNDRLMIKLCWDIGLNLFDDIEILATILPQKESLAIPFPLDVIIIGCVFLSLILSVLVIAENKITTEEEKNKKHKNTTEEEKNRKHKNTTEEEKNKKLYLFRLVVQMLVYFPLLVIRLVVWLKYEHNASIFIAKNLMNIWISILEILKAGNFCGFQSETVDTGGNASPTGQST